MAAVVVVVVAAATAVVVDGGYCCLSCTSCGGCLSVNHQLEVDGTPPVRTIVLDVVGPCLAFDVDKDTSCKGEGGRPGRSG